MNLDSIFQQHLEGKSIRELAQQEGTSAQTLSRRLRKAGHSPRTPREAKVLFNKTADRGKIPSPGRNTLDRLYLGEMLTLNELARRFEVSSKTALGWLIDEGIERRDSRSLTIARNVSRTGEKRSTSTPSDYQQALRKKKRLLVSDHKTSVGCQRCGEKHPATLDLHHRDRDEKHHLLCSYVSGSGRGRIGGRGWGSLSYADIEAELAKCDVLCSNCHRILEWEEANMID